MKATKLAPRELKPAVAARVPLRSPAARRAAATKTAPAAPQPKLSADLATTGASERYLLAAAPRAIRLAVERGEQGIHAAAQSGLEFIQPKAISTADASLDVKVTIAGAIAWTGKKFGKPSYRMTAPQAYDRDMGRYVGRMIDTRRHTPTIHERAETPQEARAARAARLGLSAETVALLGYGPKPVPVELAAKVAARKPAALKACKRTVKVS